MYISANLPERYGVFDDIRKDNFPFNQTFSKYIELIAQIGTYHRLGIVEVIGFIEDGIMGDERLPDVPEGNVPVQFRFKTESEITQNYYKAQGMTNRQITLLIIIMTLRLSERYGTSLYRIYSKIEAVSGLSGQKKTVLRKEDIAPKSVNNEETSEPVVEKPKVTIKKRKRIVTEPAPEPVTPEKVEEPVDEEPADVEIAGGEPEEQESEDIISRMERLTKQGQQLLGTPDEDEDNNDVVVQTNPALGDFFQTD